MRRPSAEMNTLETILARRSVRSYREEAVGRRALQTLLEAAVRAPTAIHEEPWAFVVVQDRQILHILSERAKPLAAEMMHQAGQAICRDEDADIFHDAGTLIVICARAIGPFAEADCWLAAENLMLAACAMGLGTCVVGSALPALHMAEIETLLGIPSDYKAVVPIIVGFPRGSTPASSRREPFVISWH